MAVREESARNRQRESERHGFYSACVYLCSTLQKYMEQESSVDTPSYTHIFRYWGVGNHLHEETVPVIDTFCSELPLFSYYSLPVRTVTLSSESQLLW